MIAVAEPTQAAPASSVLTESQVIRRLQETVSASRLSLFHQCRLKFWFRYVAGIVKPKTAALHVGSAVHAALKAWSKARWRQQPLSLKGLHDEFTKAWADEPDSVSWEDTNEDEEKATGWRSHCRKRSSRMRTTATSTSRSMEKPSVIGSTPSMSCKCGMTT